MVVLVFLIDSSIKTSISLAHVLYLVLSGVWLRFVNRFIKQNNNNNNDDDGADDLIVLLNSARTAADRRKQWISLQIQ